MLGPIQRLILLNPVQGVIETQPGQNAAYNPTLAGDATIPLANLWPVVGALSGVQLESAESQGTFSINVEDRPAEMTDRNSRLHFADAEFGITRVRARYLNGQISGYTLELGL